MHPIRLMQLNWLQFYSNFCFRRSLVLTEAARSDVYAPHVRSPPARVLQARVKSFCRHVLGCLVYKKRPRMLI